MEAHKTTTAAPGRHEADGQEARPAVRKRAWFYYALARLAVARNLAVAAAIAMICLGAVGLTLQAMSAKLHPDAAAAPELPPLQVLQPLKSGPTSVFEVRQLGRDGLSMLMVDFNKYPELYVPVSFTHKCGHEGTFTPADSQFSAMDPAGYKARLEQQLCPSCKAQADYRARKAAKKSAAGNGKANAAH